jgi:hypothetical protein
MRAILEAVAAAVLTACSGSAESERSDAATSDSVTDTGSPESSVDTALPDTSVCPEYFPGEGQACSVTMPCTFKDTSCGGTLAATCADGKWKQTTPPSTCEPYCPPRMPAGDSACDSYPAGRVCRFWPVSMDSCQSCTCESGKWTCAAASCPLSYAECKPGTACTANTGCGAGKCNHFCACGVDAVLHCSANPC